MWEYFKNCLKRNNRFFFEHPLLSVLEGEFKRNEYKLSRGTAIYRARIDYDNKLWNDYCRIESTPMQLKSLEKKGAVPNDKLTDFWKEYEDFINSEKLKGLSYVLNQVFKDLMPKEVLLPPKRNHRSG